MQVRVNIACYVMGLCVERDIFQRKWRDCHSQTNDVMIDIYMQ